MLGMIAAGAVLGAASPLSAQCNGTSEVYGWDLWWSANREDFLPWRAPPSSERYAGGVRPPAPEEIRAAVIPVLLAGLEDRDARIRDAAAIAIGRCGDARDVAALTRALADPNHVVAAAAIIGLGLISQPSADEVLIRMLGSTETGTRDRGLAAIALGLSGGESGRKPLFEELGSRRPTTLEACRMLGAALWAGADVRGGESDRSPLAASLLQRAIDNPAVTSRALRSIGIAALAKVRDPGSLQFVLAAVASSRADIRAAAAVAAGRVVRAGDKKSVNALVAALASEGAPWPRRMFLVALGRIGGPDAVGQLVQELEHPDAQHRAFAAIALGIAGALEVAPRFREELAGNASDRAKGSLAIALGLMNDAPSDPVLARLLADAGTSGELAQHCLWFFALRRNRASVPLLVRVIETTRVPCVQDRAAIALGAMGAVEAQPALARLLLEGPLVVKPSAALALGRMGDRGALAALLEAATADRVDGTRAAAIEGLGALAQRNPWSPLARTCIDSVYDPQNDAIDEVCWRGGKARIIFDGDPKRKK
jgi:HEAT repeat protein